MPRPRMLYNSYKYRRITNTLYGLGQIDRSSEFGFIVTDPPFSAEVWVALGTIIPCHFANELGHWQLVQRSACPEPTERIEYCVQ